MSTPSSAASPAPSSSSSSSCCLLPLSCHLPVLDRSIKFYKLLIRLGVCVCVCVDPYYITRCVYTLWAHAPLLFCLLPPLFVFVFVFMLLLLMFTFLIFLLVFVLLFLLMLRYLLYFIYYLDIAQPSFTSTMQSRRVCSLICLLTFLTPTPTLTLTSTLT